MTSSPEHSGLQAQLCEGPGAGRRVRGTEHGVTRLRAGSLQPRSHGHRRAQCPGPMCGPGRGGPLLGGPAVGRVALGAGVQGGAGSPAGRAALQWAAASCGPGTAPPPGTPAPTPEGEWQGPPPGHPQPRTQAPSPKSSRGAGPRGGRPRVTLASPWGEGAARAGFLPASALLALPARVAPCPRAPRELTLCWAALFLPLGRAPCSGGSEGGRDPQRKGRVLLCEARKDVAS